MTSQDKERTLTLQAKVPGGFSLSCSNDRPLDFSLILFADPNRAGFQWLHAERYSWQDGFHIGQASTRPIWGKHGMALLQEQPDENPGSSG